MLSEAYLGLGSNLGNKWNNIVRAVDRIRAMSSSLTCSSLYESRAQGFNDQPGFINAVCRVWTTLDPFTLLREVQTIQESVGGRRTFTNGPRRLDIDILLYGTSVIDTPALAVPHPRMWERGFVLAPLAELAPHLRHPATDETVISLLNRLSPTIQVVKPGPPVNPASTALVVSHGCNKRFSSHPPALRVWGGIPKPLPKRFAPSLDSPAGQAKSGVTKN